MVSKAVEKHMAEWGELGDVHGDKDLCTSSFFLIGRPDLAKKILVDGKKKRGGNWRNLKIEVKKSVNARYTYVHDKKRLAEKGSLKNSVFCVRFDGQLFPEEWLENLLKSLTTVVTIQRWRLSGDVKLKDGSWFEAWIDLLAFIDTNGDFAAETCYHSQDEIDRERAAYEKAGELDPDGEFKYVDEKGEEKSIKQYPPVVVEDVESKAISTFDPLAW